jgi:hypothetical protein
MPLRLLIDAIVFTFAHELNASDLLKAAYAARERTACRLLVIIVGIA